MIILQKKSREIFLAQLLRIFIIINAFILTKGKVIEEEDYPIKVSIIIATHNDGPLLERSINSALNQTLKEIEVIVINDGSTDNTLETLKKYEGEEKIKIINLPTNQGQSSATNLGIDTASGEFVTFLDGDDLVDLDYYENLYKLSKDMDVVAGMYVISANGTDKYYHDDYFYNHVDDHGAVGDTIWRKKYLDEKNIRFDKNKKIGIDREFRTTVYKTNPRRIQAPDFGSYYIYKRRAGSLMNYSEGLIKGDLNKAEEEHAKNNSIKFDNVFDFIKEHFIIITISLVLFIVCINLIIRHINNKKLLPYSSLNTENDDSINSH